VEVRHGEVEDPTVEEVEEEERAEGLVLGGGGGVARSREIIEESGDLGGAELRGWRPAWKATKARIQWRYASSVRGESCRRRKAAWTASTRVIQSYRRERGERCAAGREKW
jgi:hypothetical protein